MDRTCEKCKKIFGKPCELKRHQQRKTSCVKEAVHDFQCEKCNHQFSTRQAKSRHATRCCTDAPDITKLLQAQQQTLDELKEIVRSTRGDQTIVVNNGTMIVKICPWDGDNRITVDTSHVASAFNENSLLMEYMGFSDSQKVDPAVAPPYVTEFFADMTRRAHSVPEARNIYLNPRRADQVLVCLEGGRWEVRSLTDALRLICDGIAKCIHKISLSAEERSKLPQGAQNALAMVGMLYGDSPTDYVRMIKEPLSAHLSNTAPADATEI